MNHGAQRRSGGASEAAVPRAPAKPWRGGSASGSAVAPAPPPKVYRVEPRDFRELVQRLTGAAGAAAAAPVGGVRQAPAPAHAVAAAHGRSREQAAAAAAAAEQFDYASWFSSPLLSPASMSAGFDVGRGGDGAFI